MEILHSLSSEERMRFLREFYAWEAGNYHLTPDKKSFSDLSTELGLQRQSPKMPDNRRSDERVTLNLSAKWHGVSGTHEGRIEDLSLGGCFVNTAGRVDTGEVVSVALKLPSGEWLHLRGEVTSYQAGIGFGVLFSFLTAEEEQTLRQLVT